MNIIYYLYLYECNVIFVNDIIHNDYSRVLGKRSLQQIHIQNVELYMHLQNLNNNEYKY